MNSVTKYHVAIRLLHWVMAILILSLMAVGFLMKRDLLPFDRLFVYGVHKKLGMTLMLLLFLRVIIRFTTKVPPASGILSKKERIIASMVHVALYFVMFLFPMSGYMMSIASGRNVHWFFGLIFPSIIGPDKNTAMRAAAAHSTLLYVVLFLLALHVLGVVKHYFFDKHNLLKRIF